MIQNFSLNIKSIFNSQQIRFYNDPVFSQIQHLETYCLNHLELSSVHTHNDSPCKSSNVKYYRSYQRHYVSFHGVIDDQILNVPVVYCENDKHYHSILLSYFIVPHSSYSICFILYVLSCKKYTSLTVEMMTDKFGISISTLYRWINKYNSYLRIFMTLKDKYHMNFFIHMLYNYTDIIDEMFDINLHTLFQSDRKQFHQSG